ncbi:MAG TPA: type I glutamate--ammonia ligase [Ktedonobacterales bacterium]
MPQPPRDRDQRPHAPTGVHNPQAEARLLEHIETRGVGFINLEFSDVVGLAKSVTIPASQLSAILARGKWFDGSAIEGLARVAETDMYLRPDLSTFTEIPWRSEGDAGEGRVGRLICDVLMPTGERFAGDPRAVLIEALRDAEAQGYRYEISPELEFFLLREQPGRAGEPLPHDRGGYFDLSIDLAADVRREIVAALNDMGVGIESSHHEVAAGQHELDFTVADALKVADGVVTARYTVKAIAQRHGLGATFLPKPFHGINGNGMHTHQRLTRLMDGSNAFVGAASASYGLSEIGRRFIAGQIAHARGMCAIVAPLVNSYKRLVPNFEAPVMVSWGRINREALIRVPRMEPGEPESMLVELRAPDPSCNPYLAFAAMLRAGLDGVARDLPLAQPVEEGLYMLDETSRLRRGIALLPADLSEALADLQGDDVMVAALGEQIAAWFVEAKTEEWNAYREQVHAWELERYLPIF